MKKITISSWAQDNAGNYHAPGTELAIGDGDDMISADAAKVLADQDAARAKLVAVATPADQGDAAA